MPWLHVISSHVQSVSRLNVCTRWTVSPDVQPASFFFPFRHKQTLMERAIIFRPAPFAFWGFLSVPITSAEWGAIEEEGIPCVYPLLSERCHCCCACIFLCVPVIHCAASGVVWENTWGFKRSYLLRVPQTPMDRPTCRLSQPFLFWIFTHVYHLGSDYICPPTHPLLCTQLSF